jgi:RNA polymerase sigma factor (sigma-70 family)
MLTDAQKFEQPDNSVGDAGEQEFRQLLCEYPALTKKEEEVLLLSIYYEYPSAEIAKLLFSSRQNINQIKLRALKKMRDMQRDD